MYFQSLLLSWPRNGEGLELFRKRRWFSCHRKWFYGKQLEGVRGIPKWFSSGEMWSGGKKFPAGGSHKMAALESSPCTPAKAATATIHKNPGDGTPLKHVHPKLPSGDSPYVRAKHVQARTLFFLFCLAPTP